MDGGQKLRSKLFVVSNHFARFIDYIEQMRTDLSCNTPFAYIVLFTNNMTLQIQYFCNHSPSSFNTFFNCTENRVDLKQLLGHPISNTVSLFMLCLKEIRIF